MLFDGQETHNTSTNDIAYTPPLESVAEFKAGEITRMFHGESNQVPIFLSRSLQNGDDSTPVMSENPPEADAGLSRS